MTETATLPRLNEPAPQFTAPSTHGEISLSDYAGKWVVLFSHPADFTPVCTTEFVEFARQSDDFEAMNTQLIGLSIDSIYAHIAWMRNIEQHFDVKVKFPVIADLSMDVAHKYGMVHPGASSTARANTRTGTGRPSTARSTRCSTASGTTSSCTTS